MKYEYTKCPECGSDKITLYNTYDITIGINVKTGKIIKRDKDFMKYNPITLYSYRCRDCGWNSDSVVL